MRDYAGTHADEQIMGSQNAEFQFRPPDNSQTKSEDIGFRFGDKGTHTSRTMMLAELEAVLDATGECADQHDYRSAIIDENCLSKVTAATRRISNQRLSELYGLNPRLPLFRVLRRLWNVDRENRPRLALLTAIARDPLLAASAVSIIPLAPGSEFQREPMKEAVGSAVGDRLNDSILQKVCRNVASSWTQSGHLTGRTLKKRQLVHASPATIALALYLANGTGYRGAAIFSSAWLRVLDCEPSQARDHSLEAKRIGLINLRMAGEVVDLDVSLLDPRSRGS